MIQKNPHRGGGGVTLNRIITTDFIKTPSSNFGVSNKISFLKIVCSLLGIIFIGVSCGSQDVFATASSLTISVSGSLTINLPPSAEGKFADSGNETISVSTTHAAGYVLKVKASSATDLKNSSGTTGFTSISSAISAETFDTSAYNGKWGYKPSKLNSTANTNYLPAPTTSGSTLDSVSSATNNNYTVSIGARANINTAIGDYSNTFVFTVTANPTPYKITYNANTTDAVSGMPSNVSSTTSGNVTISSTEPTREDYLFQGWCTAQVADGASCTGTSYAAGGTFEIDQTASSNNLTLYAMWEESCDAGYICYKSNAGTDTVEGTMADQSVGASATSATLQAYNFKRSGYAFLGWSTKSNPTIGTDTIYGPMETISFSALASEGLKLYAVWLPKSTEYTMQTFSASVCSSKLTKVTYNSSSATFTATANSFIALEDNRDGNVYTIARLSDGNCWMLENLRLDDSATISSTNTNNPISSFTKLSATSSSWCTTNSSACNDQSMLNTTNMNMNGTYTGNWYAYGNYYNWYSATAGNGTYSKSSGAVSGDICPKNWRLPIGANSTATYSFGALSTSMGGTSATMNTSSTPTGAVMSARLRQFPNNLVYSGNWYSSSAYSRGSVGLYWSATADDSVYAYNLGVYRTSVYPGTISSYKYGGNAVRCVAGS